jgi:hypothetical protein
VKTPRYALTAMIRELTLADYAAVRALATDTVVETGIADGVSSARRLLPLQKKGKGCCSSSALKTQRFYHAESISAGLFPSSCALLGRFMSVTSDKLSPLGHKSKLSGYLSTTGIPSYDRMMWEFEAACPKLPNFNIVGFSSPTMYSGIALLRFCSQDT